MEKEKSIQYLFNVISWVLILFAACYFKSPKILLAWMFSMAHLLMLFSSRYRF